MNTCITPPAWDGGPLADDDVLQLADVAASIRAELLDVIGPVVITLRDCPVTGTAADDVAMDLIVALARVTVLAEALAATA